MDRKDYDKLDGARRLSDDHPKVHMLLKRKSSTRDSSNDSSGSLSPRRPLHHSSASDSDGRNHSSNGSRSGKPKRNLRSRQSSGSSSEELKDDNPIFSSSQAKYQPQYDSALHTQKDVDGKLKRAESIEASIESRDIRLKQLSSERDRSISVDRHSSSSSEGRSTQAKNVPKNRSDSPKGKDCVINKDSKRSDRSQSKDSKSRSHTPKEISRRSDAKKREIDDDRRPNKYRRSRSRSRSRSLSRHRRRDYSPRRDGRRSKDRLRDRSPRRRSSPMRNRRSRSRSYGSRKPSRGHYDRNHGRHRQSRSRSYERRRFRRDRSSSHDRQKRRRSPSSSRSRSRGHSPRDRLKGKPGTNVSKLGSLPLSTTAGTMTPQMVLQQTMAAMSAKAQALTGIELPKYYNPAAVNPLKYAEQVQKRKLLWQTKKETTQEQSKSVWDKLTFTQDQDGKMTQKFRKLMGIKGENEANEAEPKEVAAAPEANIEPAALQKQEELFRNLDQQYEMARMSTHTHRGVGLGYSTQPIFPPLQKP